MQWISIIFQLILLITGSLLGEAYNNSLYLYWLIAMAALTIFSQFLISSLIKVNNELKLYKERVSAFSTLKENAANDAVQIAVFPEKRVIIGQDVKLELFLTSTYPLDSSPDIKLITQSEWNVTISNQTQLGKRYAGNYEYVLFDPSFMEIKEEKFLKVNFFVKFTNHGMKNFLIEFNNGSTRGSLTTSLKVHKS